MDLSKTERNILLLVATGAIAGLLGGLLGIGGGIILVPIFVFFFGFTQHKAHGTSLLVLACLSFVGMLGYWGHGLVDWRIAVCIMAGSIVGALIGGMLVKVIKSRMLRTIFCIVLGFVSLRMILSGFGINLFSAHIGHSEHGFLRQLIIYVSTGLLTGVLSAILGVGGGLIVVPALVVGLGIPQHVAQGISLTVMFPTAVTGAMMHIKMGNTDMRVGKWAGLGAALTTLIGLNLASSLKSDTLQLIFGLFMAAMAVLLITKKDKNTVNQKTDGAIDE